MKSTEIVKELMKSKGHTNESLAKKVGYSRASGVSERLRGKSMRVDTLVSLLEAMDCELVVRSKLSDKNQWVVEDGEE